VEPVISCKARDAPQDAQGFDGASGFSLSHVFYFQAKLIAESRHCLLGAGIAAGHEHGGLAALELRVDHGGRTGRIEGLDEVGAGKLLLQLLHQGFIMVREKFQYPIRGRCIGDGIGGIYDDLACNVAASGGVEGLQGHSTLDRQHNHIGEFGRLGKASNLGLWIGGSEILELCPITRAQRQFMTVFEEARAQRLGYIARTQNANFHF